MIVKEYLMAEIETLDTKQLFNLEKFVRFLKFCSREEPFLKFDEKQTAKLYAEFAEDNRLLAEEGIEDYQKGLLEEDEVSKTPQVSLTLDFDQLIKLVEYLPEKERQRLHECLHKPRLKREDYFKIVGLGKSDASDVSENHDKYLGEALYNEHLR